MPQKWKYLRENDIPEWIRCSPYLESLLENEPLPESGLKVPKWCLKRDTTIRCHNDAVQFIRTARYWLLPDELVLDSNLLNYCFSQCRPGMEELEAEHQSLRGLAAVVSAPDNEKMEQAALHDAHSLLLHHLHDSLRLPVTSATLSAAARMGNIEFLKFFRARGLPFTPELPAEASKNGHLACLVYLHQQGAPLTIAMVANAVDAHPKRRECLKYALQHYVGNYDAYEFTSSCSLSARFNDLESIKIVLEHVQQPSIHDVILTGAATGGSFRILQYCIEQGVLVTKPQDLLNTCARSSSNDWFSLTRHYLQCIEYLYSLGYSGSAQTLEAAAEGGHVPTLAFLLEHACPASDNVCTILASHGNTEGLQLVRTYGLSWDDSTCAAAAKYGSITCLQYLHDSLCPWDTHTCISAAGAGALDCLKFAHQNDCPWDERTCAAAARGGHIDCLRYAHENGCPWKTKSKTSTEKCESIALSAARAPTSDCLVYVVERGAPVRSSCMRIAAGAKCLQSVVFLRAHGCTWDTEVCTEAVRAGSLECLVYLHENGCPWDLQTYFATARFNDTYSYYTKNKCSWDEAAAWREQVRKCAEYMREHNYPKPQYWGNWGW